MVQKYCEEDVKVDEPPLHAVILIKFLLFYILYLWTVYDLNVMCIIYVSNSSEINMLMKYVCNNDIFASFLPLHFFLFLDLYRCLFLSFYLNSLNYMIASISFRHWLKIPGNSVTWEGKLDNGHKSNSIVLDGKKFNSVAL